MCISLSLYMYIYIYIYTFWYNGTVNASVSIPKTRPDGDSKPSSGGCKQHVVKPVQLSLGTVLERRSMMLSTQIWNR